MDLETFFLVKFKSLVDIPVLLSTSLMLSLSSSESLSKLKSVSLLSSIKEDKSLITFPSDLFISPAEMASSIIERMRLIDLIATSTISPSSSESYNFFNSVKNGRYSSLYLLYKIEKILSLTSSILINLLLNVILPLTRIFYLFF